MAAAKESKIPDAHFSGRNLDERVTVKLDGYSVYEWTPERDGKGTPTEVHLVFDVPDTAEVRFWVRGERWTAPLFPGEKPGPSRVQFCRLRGRINAVFDCYEAGTMPCYEPEPEPEPAKGGG